jgi:hypothetical protein
MLLISQSARVLANHRTLHSGFGVDEMVATLPVEGEAVLFEDLGERPVVEGAEWGHLLHAQGQSIKRYEFRCSPRIACPLVAGLFENFRVPISVLVSRNPRTASRMFLRASSSVAPQLDRSSSGT